MAFIAIVSHGKHTARALTNDLIDLFRTWDEDGDDDGTVDKRSFRMGLAALHLSASPEDVDALFAAIDPSHSGRIRYDALNRWMQAGASRLDKVHRRGVRTRVAAAAAEVDERARLAQTAQMADELSRTRSKIAQIQARQHHRATREVWRTAGGFPIGGLSHARYALPHLGTHGSSMGAASSSQPSLHGRGELRYDTDGELYTRAEFLEYYGGDLEWELAERPTLDPSSSVGIGQPQQPQQQLAASQSLPQIGGVPGSPSPKGGGAPGGGLQRGVSTRFKHDPIQLHELAKLKSPKPRKGGKGGDDDAGGASSGGADAAAAAQKKGGGALALLKRASKASLLMNHRHGAPGPPSSPPGALNRGKTRASTALRNSEFSLEEGAKELSQQLREALVSNASRVIDLFREWDEDGDGMISKKEFEVAMPMLGLHVDLTVVHSLFDEFDCDASGEISFRELNKILRRDTKKVASAKEVKKEPNSADLLVDISRIRREVMTEGRKKMDMLVGDPRMVDENGNYRKRLDR